MKRLLLLLAFLTSPVLAQVSTAPPLLAYRGANLPTNCQIGQLWFKTNATAGQNIYECTAANTWVQQGAAVAATVTIANDVTTNATMYPVWVTANTGNLPLKVSSTEMSWNPSTGVLTAPTITATTALVSSTWTISGTQAISGNGGTQILVYVDSVYPWAWNSTTWQGSSTAKIAWNSSATSYGSGGDIFLSRYATKQLMISGDGTGASTNSGWIIGYGLASGYGGLYASTLTPNAANHTLIADGNNTYLNASTTLNLAVANVTKQTFPVTAGAGPSITSGTATTDVAALSVTRTNNNAAVATGVQFAFTDTSSAAGFLPFQVLGGAAAATNLFSLSKAGAVTVGSKYIAPNGTVTTPSYTFSSDTGTGINYSGDGGLEFVNSVTQATFKNGVGLRILSTSAVGFASGAPTSTAMDIGISRNAAGVMCFDTTTIGNCAGATKAAGTMSTGTKFTASGCTNSATAGGATAGTFASGTTGACTVVITMNGATGLTAPTGWVCAVSNQTTANLIRQSASTTTTATVTGTTVSGDVIAFHCMGY